MNAFLIHHLGLGDHILCNSLTRELSKKYNTLYFPVKFHNIENLEKMFEDLNNIHFLLVKNDEEMIFLKEKYKSICEIISIGNFGKNFLSDTNDFCESFYKQANIPYLKRWENFFTGAINTSDMIPTSNQEYVFLHDDASRNLEIKKKFQFKSVFRPQHHFGKSTEKTIFHYKNIFLNAKEIHCMDSSFACLIDHLTELKDKPKFIHRYIRKNSLNPFYKNNWIILDE
jgi:hypothetical protein